MGQLKCAFEVFHMRIGRMRGGSYVYGQGNTFFRYDTRMSKLVCVWADNSELAFGVFMKVISLNVRFYFPPFRCHSELWRSRHDRNTTRLSWCEMWCKIDFVNLSENSSRSFSDHLFYFFKPTKYVNLPKKIKEIPGVIKTLTNMKLKKLTYKPLKLYGKCK